MQKVTNNTLAAGLVLWRSILVRGARPVSLGDLVALDPSRSDQKMRRILRTLEAAGMLDRQGDQWVLGEGFRALYASYEQDIMVRKEEADEAARIEKQVVATLDENRRRALFLEGPI